MKKPLIIFVFAKQRPPGSPRFDGFYERLIKASGFPEVDVVTVALENLIFEIKANGSADITDSLSGVSMTEAKFVYFKSWQSMIEEAAALSNFLFYSRIPFADQLPLGMGVSKLATAFRLWGQGLAQPASVYIRNRELLASKMSNYTALGDKIIVKDAKGEKGKFNFLSDRKKVESIIQEYPDVHFICQEFVPNDGDYRIGVYFGQPSFAIKRISSGQSHLNNTSAGGSAQYLPINSVPNEMLELAVAAARAAGLQVAGVDIIVNKSSNKAYVLEVNQGSQIVSGVYTAENIKGFNAALTHHLSGKLMRQAVSPLTVIGRRTYISSEDLGIAEAVGKVDTGAYVSSIHAENIHIENERGEKVLVFEIKPMKYLKTVTSKVHVVRTKQYSRRVVKSSNGSEEQRFSVKMRIKVNGLPVTAIFTLTDRIEMTYPLLLGRTVLYSKFLVDVERTEKFNPEV